MFTLAINYNNKKAEKLKVLFCLFFFCTAKGLMPFFMFTNFFSYFLHHTQNFFKKLLSLFFQINKLADLLKNTLFFLQ